MYVWAVAASCGRAAVDVGALPSGSVCSGRSCSVFLLVAPFFFSVTSHWAQRRPNDGDKHYQAANDQTGFTVGWREQLDTLASASVRPSVRQLPDLFWLNAALSGDSTDTAAVPSSRCRLASQQVAKFRDRKGTFPFPANLKQAGEKNKG